jgi:hypothetical protein
MGLKLSTPVSSPVKNKASAAAMSIFQHTVNLIDGTPLDLSTLNGKKKAFLVVNMASY